VVRIKLSTRSMMLSNQQWPCASPQITWMIWVCTVTSIQSHMAMLVSILSMWHNFHLMLSHCSSWSALSKADHAAFICFEVLSNKRVRCDSTPSCVYVLVNVEQMH
jgi:hypothetical protein